MPRTTNAIVAAVAALTMLGTVAPTPNTAAAAMTEEERQAVHDAVRERWGWKRWCVVVNPETCSGGTLDISNLTSDTPLYMPGSRTNSIVMDLTALKWTSCATIHNAPATEQYERECPTMALDPSGFYVLVAMLLALACVQFFCPAWANVAAFWCGDLAAGLFSAVVIEYSYPVLPSWQQLPLVVALEFFVYDGPQMFCKFCVGCFKGSSDEDSCIWKFSCYLFCCLWGTVAIGVTCMPSFIAIVGPHPLALGFVSFLLDFPKEMAKNWVMRKGSNEGYIFLLSDLEHPLPDTCRLQKGMKAAGYSGFLGA